MTRNDTAYDVIRRAGHYREGDAGLGAQPGRSSRSRATPRKPEIKAAVESLFKVKVKAVNTLSPQGQA